MTKDQSPAEEAKQAAWKKVTRLVGRHLLVSTLTFGIVVGWVLQLGGITVNAWHYISELFSERKSVLTGAEIEVANEWVIYIDSGAEFAQVEAHRISLLNCAQKSGKEDDPWNHFVRNLRIVRDPKQAGNWLLVADINSGQSTEELVEYTLCCVKDKVSNWAELDTFGSSLEAAHVIAYRIGEFSRTYGRPKNIDLVRYSEEDLISNEQKGSLECPLPYN